jgi:hypothetical protein
LFAEFFLYLQTLLRLIGITLMPDRLIVRLEGKGNVDFIGRSDFDMRDRLCQIGLLLFSS